MGRTRDNIDAHGYRSNVGIVIANDRGQVLWARRVGGYDAWQFPQGGILRDESPQTALYRELYEEVGVQRDGVEIVASTRGWLRYRLPKRYLRHNGRGGRSQKFVGQKQKWFLLEFTGEDGDIDIAHDHKEFGRWRWSTPDEVLRDIVPFKRAVYDKVIAAFRERIEA